MAIVSGSFHRLHGSAFPSSVVQRTNNNLCFRRFPSSVVQRTDNNLSCIRFGTKMSSLGISMEERKKDKQATSWVDLYLPREARPYAHLARLDKPIGNWLLAWPSMWTMWSISLAVAPGNFPNFEMMGWFGCAALLLRALGCTINDFVDKDTDAKVERTKSRPLANGALTPFQGLCFLGFQLLLALGMLSQLDACSRILGATFLFLTFTYPFMKRLIFWQAYLGLVINMGALSGWSVARAGSLDLPIVVPLYVGGIFWTLVYDTIYAHQDKVDDLKLGLHSTALWFGDSTKECITGFAIACISSITLSGMNANIGWPFYVSLVVALGHLIWQIWTVDLSSPLDCSRKFLSNKWFGAIIFLGIFFGRLWS